MKELSEIHSAKNEKDKFEAIQGSNWSDTDVRSVEVQEIIGRPPHWLVRGGITAFMGLLILVFLCAWFVQYPETINAPLKLIAINAPKTLKSKINGKLVRLCSKNNTYVRSGQMLAWLESTANHQEVLELSAQIDSMNEWLREKKFKKISTVQLATFTDLGELQTNFQTFEQAWREFISFLPSGFYHQKRHMLKQEMQYTHLLMEQLIAQKEIHKEDYEISKKEYSIQKKLSQKEFIAPMDLAKKESELLAHKLTLQQTESALIRNFAEQSAKKKKLMELDKRIAEQKSIFLQALNTLKSAVDEWEKNHLIISPIKGKLIYAGIVQENQSLAAGQDIFYIQPDNTRFFGELSISQNSFGKIQKGQKVLVRFSGYPYQEFGSVTGRLNYLSDFPIGDSIFIAKVSFPEGLNSNYGKELSPANGMTAHAKIITQDMRLLERFYKNMIKKL